MQVRRPLPRWFDGASHALRCFVAGGPSIASTPNRLNPDALAELLLTQMRTGKLTEPFDHLPPLVPGEEEGAIPMLRRDLIPGARPRPGHVMTTQEGIDLAKQSYDEKEEERERGEHRQWVKEARLRKQAETLLCSPPKGPNTHIRYPDTLTRLRHPRDDLVGRRVRPRAPPRQVLPVPRRHLATASSAKIGFVPTLMGELNGGAPKFRCEC